MSEKMDMKAVEQAVASMLRAVGEDPAREGLATTPHRVARMYGELFAGLHEDPAEHLEVAFTQPYDDMVVLRDIPFYSTCEHHLVPFHGMAHVGYVPNGRVTGISKLARVVETIAKRPQLQERLTSQIADVIMDTLEPDGVAVVVEAEHLCVSMRGIRKSGAKMVTSAVRGSFKLSAVTRSEFLALVRSGS